MSGINSIQIQTGQPRFERNPVNQSYEASVDMCRQ